MIKLYEHNEQAYKSVVERFEKVNKTSVIHPTGTGKSYIAFRLCEENPDKKICWLSPSEYIFKTQIESLLHKGEDVPQNIQFFTYAKLIYMTETEFEEIKPDFIILDEFHRCGAELWGEKVELLLENNQNSKVLGLTATHIRYLDNARDMVDEIFDGDIASEITLGEAIVRGILPTPKYITAIYEKAIERYETKVKKLKNKAVFEKSNKYLDDLKRALQESQGLVQIFARHMKKGEKYIAFCSDKEHLDEMMAMSHEWFEHVDRDFKSYVAYSLDPETEKSFADFKADNSENLKILFCIDMLNEGVHVEDITGVILLRPTVSPILYKQQIGRALSTSGKSEPIIFDIVNNFENLYSLGSIQSEMNESLQYFRKNDKIDKIISEKFNIYEEIPNARVLFNSLQESMTASFDTMFELAKEYYEKQGDLNMPIAYKTAEGFALGGFIARQRAIRKGTTLGYLDDIRIEKLNSIGMVWEGRKESSFIKNMRLCEEYYEKYGDLIVKHNFKSDDGTNLGIFISAIRKKFIKNELSEEIVQEFESIGMVWNVNSHIFEENYKLCLEFYDKFKHLDIPAAYKVDGGFTLGAWISDLRRKYKNGKLSDYEILKLEKIDMIWDKKREILWENAYQKAKKYFETYGNVDVKTTFITEDGYSLGSWVKVQRNTGKEKLGNAKVSKLDAINFVWEKQKSRKAKTWLDIYDLAKQFYEQNDHLNIPSDFVSEDVWLGDWLRLQKNIYRQKVKGDLSSEQIKMLEDIGVDWLSSVERAWENRYNYAYLAYVKNGDARDVNGLGIDQKYMRKWIAKQQKAMKEGTIPQNYEVRLRDIGIS
ncbi:MAG: Helicase associated domain protein [Clostridia bacterium]